MHEETLKYRIGHLVSYVKKTFDNIPFDEIARQMEKHEVSAPFSPDRILEIFAAILWRERESLINDSVVDIKSARGTRKKVAAELEARRAAHQEQFDASCNENLRLRRELNALEEEVYGKAWKSYRIRHDVAARAQDVQSRINDHVECISDVLRKTQDINDSAQEVRQMIQSTNARFADAMREARASVQEFLAHQRNRIEGADLVRKYEANLRVQREITEQTRASLAKFIAHVNEMGKDCELEISSISEKRVTKALRSTVSGMRHRVGFGANPGMEVEEVVIERVQEKENEYKARLRKQKKSMQRLQVELNAAKKRLATLLQADASLDPELMNMIEKSKKTMQVTQAKTDEMMRLIQDRSYSSFESFL